MRSTAAALMGFLLVIQAAAAADYVICVSNERSGDVTLIDGKSHKPVATIAVGKRPRGIAVSRDGKRLYVALSGTPIEGPPGSKERDEREKLPVDRKADGIGIV